MASYLDNLFAAGGGGHRSHGSRRASWIPGHSRCPGNPRGYRRDRLGWPDWATGARGATGSSGATGSAGATGATGAFSPRYAKNVVTEVVSNLSSYPVTPREGNDFVENVAGDVVILAGATTTEADLALRGPYVVGTVTGTTAPLTRPSWFTGTLSTGNQYAVVLGGYRYNGSSWNSFCMTPTFDVATGVYWYMPYSVTNRETQTLGLQVSLRLYCLYCLGSR